ncbi:hypothetical protein RMCBS344292_10464 [Rhizopus microsporus]|nr:hypothetical protein RMCBS344292_10464 [Rhizopus microsporus]
MLYQLSFTIADALIHCLYSPSSLDNQTALKILSSLPSTTPNTRQTIICGDFNARLGSYTGDRSTNPRGNVVHRWLKEKGIIVWNRRLAFGQPTFLTHKGSSIIDLFMSTTELNEPEMKIFVDKSLGSNHKVVSFSFETTALYQPTQIQRAIWNLGKLREQKVRDAYTQQVQSALTRLRLSTQSVYHRVDDVKTAQRCIEEFNHSICQIIYDSLDATCGRVTSGFSYWQGFWTTEILQAIETREHYYRKWRKAYGLNKLHYWI